MTTILEFLKEKRSNYIKFIQEVMALELVLMLIMNMII